MQRKKYINTENNSILGKMRNTKNNIISFRSSKLSPEINSFLKKLPNRNELTDFITESISRNYHMTFHPKKFTFDWITSHFGLSKHILRMVGRYCKKIKTGMP